MADEEIIGLSENDARILRKMAQNERNRGSSGMVNTFPDLVDTSSPDLYLA